MSKKVDHDDNSDAIKALEAEIDQLFDSSELLKHPFCVVYNSFCQMMAISESEYVADCFIYIAEKLTDFTPLSEDECWERIATISISDWSTAYQCATLNQIFPLVHRDIYRLEISNNKKTLKYSTRHKGEIELRDEVITRLSLPVIDFGKFAEDEFYIGILRRLERNERLNILRGVNTIKKLYKRLPKEFYGEELICAPIYQLLGFSSKESFYKIRNAFFAVSEALMRARGIVEKFLTHKNISESTDHAENLLKSLSMIVVDESELKKTILSIAETIESDYENFCKFFFHQPKTGHKLSKTCVPAFWNLQTKIYFSPFFIVRLLTPRNLLMIAKNDAKLKKIYDYDRNISCHLEPNLIKRAINIFKKKFNTHPEKRFDCSEIDLLVYCNKSNSILIVQAKATLPPDGAREVDRLDGRIEEAKDQLDIFYRLTEHQKLQIASKCFPGEAINSHTKFLSGILVNSSFGSFKSWDLMKNADILPLNCQLLNSTIKDINDLIGLKTCIWEYISKTVKTCQPKLEEKYFRHPNFDLKQEKWEFDIKLAINCSNSNLI